VTYERQIFDVSIELNPGLLKIFDENDHSYNVKLPLANFGYSFFQEEFQQKICSNLYIESSPAEFAFAMVALLTDKVFYYSRLFGSNILKYKSTRNPNVQVDYTFKVHLELAPCTIFKNGSGIELISLFDGPIICLISSCGFEVTKNQEFASKAILLPNLHLIFRKKSVNNTSMRSILEIKAVQLLICISNLMCDVDFSGLSYIKQGMVVSLDFFSMQLLDSDVQSLKNLNEFLFEFSGTEFFSENNAQTSAQNDFEAVPSYLNSLCYARKTSVSFNLNEIPQLKNIVKFEIDLIYSQSCSFDHRYLPKNLLLNIHFSPFDINLITTSSSEGISGALRIGQPNFKFYLIPATRNSEVLSSFELLRSTAIYDIFFEYCIFAVYSNQRKSVIFKLEIFPLRIRGGNKQELKSHANEVIISDRFLLKVCPSTFSDLSSCYVSLAYYLKSINLSAQTHHSPSRISASQGSFVFSYGRFDLHLMRDENSKDYIAIIGIDGAISLDQQVINTFGSNILDQDLRVDFGIHDFEDEVIGAKRSSDGGFYIAHMQNEDNLVNVVMQVPGVLLRLRTSSVGSKTDAYFFAYFDHDIELPVKLGYYRWIGDLFGVYVIALKNQGSTEKLKEEKQRVFEIREFFFKPSINSIGQLIPVDKALAYFGFKTQDFPSALYDSLTIPLSSVLNMIGSMLEEYDKAVAN
jgi:hypothetical protein